MSSAHASRRGVLVYLLISFGLAWAVQVGVALTAGEQMAGLLRSGGGVVGVDRASCSTETRGASR